MPRFFCDYCDTYLTHDSQKGRKQHNYGYKHRENYRMHFQQVLGSGAFVPILPPGFPGGPPMPGFGAPGMPGFPAGMPPPGAPPPGFPIMPPGASGPPPLGFSAPPPGFPSAAPPGMPPAGMAFSAPPPFAPTFGGFPRPAGPPQPPGASQHWPGDAR